MSRDLWRVLRADWKRHGDRRGGFWALAVYRCGRWSRELPSPTSRWLTSKLYGLANQGVKSFVGVDLPRDTELGEEPLFLRTGMNFFHPSAKIGDRVRIMHGVTIGTNMGESAPTIGNDVFIDCHASLLGGITIGDGARIAANSLVVTDIPAGALAMGVPARVVKPAVAAQTSEPPRSPPESAPPKRVPSRPS